MKARRGGSLAPFNKSDRYADPSVYRQPRSGELYNDWLNCLIFVMESGDRIAFTLDALPDGFPMVGDPVPELAAAIEAALDSYYATPITALPPEERLHPDFRRDARRKLTAEDVCRIRNGGEPTPLLTVELGVHRNTIAEIRRGAKRTDVKCNGVHVATDADSDELQLLDDIGDFNPDMPDPRLW